MSKIRSAHPVSTLDVSTLIRAAKWFKEYSLYSLLIVLASGFAYVAYERSAYETKLSLKNEMISLKEEKIAYLEDLLQQERASAKVERQRTTLYVRQMDELFGKQLELINYTVKVRVNVADQRAPEIEQHAPEE